MDALSRLVVPVVALAALLGSGAWLASHHDRWGDGRWGDGRWSMGHHGGPNGAWGPGGAWGPMQPGPMQHWGPGSLGDPAGGAPVDDLDEARDRAQAYADTLGADLRVGEVMRFSDNYYAEVEETDGTNATELLVDPRTGVVRLEYGPAMMWNTRYGMMPRSSSRSPLEPDEARAEAEAWAAEHDGLTVADPEAFPGYYTLHTLRDDRIEGMLSVHANDGTVWYHGWHGDFVEMSEAE